MAKFFTEEYKDYSGATRRRPRQGRIIGAAVLFLFVLITVFNSFTFIQTGCTGVRSTFGQIEMEPVPNGLCWKIPYVQRIIKVNNRQQEQVFNDRIWGESSERTVVYMEGVNVTYRINPEYSAWLYANVTNYKQNALPETLVADAMKAAMVSLPSDEVTNRSKISPLAVKLLQSAIDAKYNGENVISIINVNITSMDFEQSYNDAIAKKQIAQLEYEEQEIRNKNALNIAEAEAEQIRIKAEAEADKKLTESNAEAQSIQTIAEAQAKANEKLSQSITEGLIDYARTEKWDGALPQVTGSQPIVSIG